MRSALSWILRAATLALIAGIASPRAESAPPAYYQAPGNYGYGYSYPRGYATYHQPAYPGYGYRQYQATPSIAPPLGGSSNYGSMRSRVTPVPRRHALPGSGRVDPGAHISRPWLRNLPKGW